MPKIPSATFCQELPSHFILGETNAEIKLSNAEENRNAATALAEQARYGINIFTQDFDHAIYDNEKFEKHIFTLATRHPSAQIRILVQDSTPAIKKGHCLIRIAQKLTSSVHIKNPPNDHKNDKSAFMTADNVGMLYRVIAEACNHEASVNFMSPQRTGKLNDFFNEVWEHSTPDLQIRRLYI